jgi:hypothetical protein
MCNYKLAARSYLKLFELHRADSIHYIGALTRNTADGKLLVEEAQTTSHLIAPLDLHWSFDYTLLSKL